MSYTPLPLPTFPGALAKYIREGAQALDADPAYIGVPMLPVIASAIGNTRRIRLKQTWSEPSVIWAATVGESGSVKSPALDMATWPVWKRQRRLLKEASKARADFEDELEEWKAIAKADRGKRPEPPPPCEHCICSDITVEALAARLEISERGTLVALDELSAWFGSFNQYKSGGSDVAHWLSMHGARTLKVDRKTGDKTTLYIPHAAVSITGTIQPKTLRRVLEPAFFDNGLAARLLVAMPPTGVKKWSDAEISGVTSAAIEELFAKLFELKPSPGLDGENEPRMVDLDPHALEAWIEFVNEHGEQIGAMTGNERAAWVKLEAYAARFALVFHVCRQVTGEKESDYVDAGDIENGVKLARWFGTETMRVYRAISETDEDRQRRELIELIVRLGRRVTPRQIKEHSRQYPTSEAAELALQALVDEAMGSWEVIRGNTKPTTYFCLADSPDLPSLNPVPVPVSQYSNEKTGMSEPERALAVKNIDDYEPGCDQVEINADDGRAGQ